MQHLLGRAKWQADAVRDDLRDYVLEHLSDEDAVLVVDETGDVKKGTHTVGVPRQYTGTAGRIENAQVAVYLVYAGRRGHAAVDRVLYIPRSWTCNADRCRAAGLGEDTAFATKPELAARMIGRFLDAGHRVGWVAALAHLPSGKFTANAAWLTLAATAYHLTRAAGHLASVFHARARTGTIRRHLIDIPARIATGARRLVLHLPRLWRWSDDFIDLWTATGQRMVI